MTEKKGRIFSGIQPTGDLHLGNYLGAIRNWVDLQSSYDCIFCVVDLHAITVYQDPIALKNSTREVAATLIACGIDIEKHILFNQSANPDHTALAWIFNCVARMGWLGRMTQFKEKAGKNRENASTGLFIYPNLMAADILAYKATHVPVGDDQKQHLELTRDIATKFNLDWKCDDFFPLPTPLIMTVAARVMSLRDGAKKMSKSDISEMSRITLKDDKDSIVKKIRKAKTDPDALPYEEKGLEQRAEAKNLVGIYAALMNVNVQDALQNDIGGQTFAQFKNILSDLLVEKLSPISDEMNRLLNDKQEIDKILRRGGEKAHGISHPILQEIQDIIGFLR